MVGTRRHRTADDQGLDPAGVERRGDVPRVETVRGVADAADVFQPGRADRVVGADVGGAAGRRGGRADGGWRRRCRSRLVQHVLDDRRRSRRGGARQSARTRDDLLLLWHRVAASAACLWSSADADRCGLVPAAPARSHHIRTGTLYRLRCAVTSGEGEQHLTSTLKTVGSTAAMPEFYVGEGHTNLAKQQNS